MKRSIPLILAGLSACTNPGYVAPEGIREASAAEVATCSYVTDIRMAAGVWGPWFEDRAIDNARKRIKLDARDAGANTVVFSPSVGVGAQLVEAKAYRC